MPGYTFAYGLLTFVGSGCLLWRTVSTGVKHLPVEEAHTPRFSSILLPVAAHPTIVVICQVVAADWNGIAQSELALNTFNIIQDSIALSESGAGRGVECRILLVDETEILKPPALPLLVLWRQSLLSLVSGLPKSYPGSAEWMPRSHPSNEQPRHV